MKRNIIDLFERQRLTREVLEHLTAMFPLEEAADVLKAMADSLEARNRAS